MKWVYPNYYPRFRCVAEKCRHNCCIGWEIDIDDASMKRYRRMKGSMGERLRSNIVDTESGGSFRMGADERCPLLNAQGLCDLILEKGEGALCQICRDHPRYRLLLTDREEIGLGLCCEAACRLILDQREPVQLILKDNGKSKAVLGKAETDDVQRRDRLLALATDRSVSMYKRMERVMEAENAGLPDLAFSDWVGVLLQLERLDEAWTKWLEKRKNGVIHAAVDDIKQEQLLVYFLYRHYLKAVRRKRFQLGAAAFCVFSTQMIALLCEKPGDVYEVARMYSAEIEYSDVNLYGMMGMLHEYNGGT